MLTELWRFSLKTLAWSRHSLIVSQITPRYLIHYHASVTSSPSAASRTVPGTGKVRRGNEAADLLTTDADGEPLGIVTLAVPRHLIRVARPRHCTVGYADTPPTFPVRMQWVSRFNVSGHLNSIKQAVHSSFAWNGIKSWLATTLLLTADISQDSGLTCTAFYCRLMLNIKVQS